MKAKFIKANKYVIVYIRALRMHDDINQLTRCIGELLETFHILDNIFSPGNPMQTRVSPDS